MDLRCEGGRKFGALSDGVLEVRCRSRDCGHETGRVVVIHRFDSTTGESLETRRFKEPSREEVKQDA